MPEKLEPVATHQSNYSTPPCISGSGPQFIAKDLKEFIRQAGLIHVERSEAVEKTASPTACTCGADYNGVKL